MKNKKKSKLTQSVVLVLGILLSTGIACTNSATTASHKANRLTNKQISEKKQFVVYAQGFRYNIRARG